MPTAWMTKAEETSSTLPRTYTRLETRSPLPGAVAQLMESHPGSRVQPALQFRQTAAAHAEAEVPEVPLNTRTMAGGMASSAS